MKYFTLFRKAFEKFEFLHEIKWMINHEKEKEMLHLFMFLVYTLSAINLRYLKIKAPTSS